MLDFRPLSKEAVTGAGSCELILSEQNNGTFDFRNINLDNPFIHAFKLIHMILHEIILSLSVYFFFYTGWLFNC